MIDTGNKIYLLDANIFIEASRRYYPLDFAMPFWDFLTRKAQEGWVRSIDKVYSELQRGQHALRDWAD